VTSSYRSLFTVVSSTSFLFFMASPSPRREKPAKVTFCGSVVERSEGLESVVVEPNREHAIDVHALLFASDVYRFVFRSDFKREL
jgi:hypothetical protein